MIPKNQNILFVLISTVLALISNFTKAQIITVKQDSTGNYATIQAAIEHAVDGDTVLVYPGIFYENIDFLGKSITVASLNILNNDPYYINQTIIDGNQQGSCVTIDSVNQLAILWGFSIQNGNGTYYGFDVLYAGGGIYVNNSTADIHNCIIKENTVTFSGGGISIRFSSLYLSSTTIKNNHAYRWGGGIYLWKSTIEFDSINLCNIYLNFAGNGTDIRKNPETPTLNVVLDTFTVIEPNNYYLNSINPYGYPQDDITWNIQHAKIEQPYNDLYVSPDGNNNNSGLTQDEPLQNIYFALLKIKSDSTNPNTIHLSNGKYAPSSNGEKYPLSLKSYVSIHGEDRDQTRLDADSMTRVITGPMMTSDYSIKHLTLCNGNDEINGSQGLGIGTMQENYNAVFEDLLITNGVGHNAGGLHFNEPVNTVIRNCDFTGNRGGHAIRMGQFWWPDVPITSDTAFIINSRFINNKPESGLDPPGGGGAMLGGLESFPYQLHCYFINCEFSNNSSFAPAGRKASCALSPTFGSKVHAINCTFGDNYSNDNLGANIGITYNASLYIYNSIMYANSPAEIYLAGDWWDTNYVHIYNSLVMGGEEAIRIYNPQDVVYYDSTNIEEDPMWIGSGEYPYALSGASPCIDAGTLNLPPEVELPETDLAGNPRISFGTIDMGAYEFFGVKVPEVRKKEKEYSLHIYPNPTAEQFVVGGWWLANGGGLVKIFDLQGRLVKVRNFPPGISEINIIIAGLKNGLYLVQGMSNQGKTGTGKLVVLS